MLKTSDFSVIQKIKRELCDSIFLTNLVQS